MTEQLYRWVKASERLGEFHDSDIPSWKFFNPDFCRVQGQPVPQGWFRKDIESGATVFSYYYTAGANFTNEIKEDKFRQIEWLEPYTPSHIEDALKWFDSNKRTMGGIYAGEYIDRQDFEEFIQSLPLPSPGDNQSLESEIETEAAEYATGMMGIGEYNEKNWAYADKQTWHLIKRTYMRAAWKHPSRPSIDIVDEWKNKATKVLRKLADVDFPDSIKNDIQELLNQSK